MYHIIIVDSASNKNNHLKKEIKIKNLLPEDWDIYGKHCSERILPMMSIHYMYKDQGTHGTGKTVKIANKKLRDLKILENSGVGGGGGNFNLIFFLIC